MVRKHERVIGTLLVWIVVLIAMSMMLDRLNYPHLASNFHWFNPSVVTGASSEEAVRVLETIQQISNDTYNEARSFVSAELSTYMPYFLIILTLPILGAVLATFFIWRSVVLPRGLSRHEDEDTDDSEVWRRDRSLKALLADDGELAEDQTPLVHQNGQE